MAFFNYAKKELSAKCVYYGPGLSGKTTNLEVIHRRMRPDQRGKLISLDTQTDRTLFFDFLPLELGEIRGFKTRFHVYTVPGQVFYNATRKVVLKGVDGVVFIADSQRDMLESNIMSLKNLEANLEEQGRKMSELPVILQYNKRDLPNVLTIEELDESLNSMGWPTFEAAAISEQGVLETLTAACKLVLKDLRETHESPRKPSRPKPAAKSLAAEPVAAAAPTPVAAAPAPVAPEPVAASAPVAAAVAAEPVTPPPANVIEEEISLDDWDDEEFAQAEAVVPPAAKPEAAPAKPEAPAEAASPGTTELTSWGEPERVSATAIRVPVEVRTESGTVSLAVTIDVTEAG